MTRLTSTLVAAMTLTALVACGSSEEVAGSNDDTTSSPPATTSAPATETESTPSDSASESPTESTGTAQTVSGTGYRISAPDGWEDITAAAKAQNPQADLAVAEADPAPFRTNFNVVVSPVGGSISRDDLVEQAARELESVTHNKVTSVPDTDFNGETAIGQTSRASASGFELALIQYLVIRDGNAYATTMTFEAAETPSAKATLDAIIASWTWS